MKKCTCKWPEEAMYCENDCLGWSTPVHFTPGVPTEDGWYVCNVLNAYYIVQVRNECTIGFKPSTILSHAKLPEL